MKLKSQLVAGVSSMHRFRAVDGKEGEQGSPADDGQQSEDSDEGGDAHEDLFKDFITDDDDSESASGGDDDDDSDEDSDDEDDDEDLDDDDEDDSDEDDEDDEESDEDEESEPKKNRAQERMDELTNQARTAEREAERWKQIAMERGAPSNLDDSALPELVEPDPEKYQYGEHDLDYIKDRAKYDAKVEARTEAAEAVFKSQAADLDAKWLKTQASAQTRYPDFDEVVVQGAKEGKWPSPPVITLGIKDSEYGADIAYHLATNVEESERISKLSPLEQAREFGRLEERQQIAQERNARRKKRREAKRISNAPKPPKRKVRGTSGSRGKPNLSDMDYDKFSREADKILARR